MLAADSPTPPVQQAQPYWSPPSVSSTSSNGAGAGVDMLDAYGALLSTDMPAYDVLTGSTRPSAASQDITTGASALVAATTTDSNSTSTTDSTSAGNKADKSCKGCRQRKVKCDRQWPKCGRCTERSLECHFSNLVPVDFIRTVDQDARVTQLESRIHSLESELAAQNFFLPAASDLMTTISAIFLAGAESPMAAMRFMDQVEEHQDHLVKLKRKFEANGEAVHMPGYGPGSLSLEVRLAKPALQRSFALHLLDAFFDSCDSCLPVFRPYAERKKQLYWHIDNLDPASRVAVATFCALGARATPHSALLGIADFEASDTKAMILSGVRRQQACKSLHAESIELSDRLEISHDTSVRSLEALMSQMQALIWQELIPRRSRSMVRSALGMFRDLQDGMFDDQERADLVKRVGLPLLVGDAITSAYGRRACLVNESDLDDYFTGLTLPNFDYDTLGSMMAVHLRSGEEPDHMQLSAASMVILRWLVACQRDFSRISSPRASQFALIPSEIMSLWSALDQIHAAIQNYQHMLMGFDRLPRGCEADGCSSMHLRFVTRLDREVDDITWLIHSLISERMQGRHGVRDELGPEWLLESERRVRKGLKLAAFYFELFATSISPNQTYYLAWQLELMPSWTSLAVQRHGEEDGPATRDLELTETELDWLEKGLEVATFYHPVAERRLIEIQSMRRPPREACLPSRATKARPRLPFDEALRRTIVASVPAWG